MDWKLLDVNGIDKTPLKHIIKKIVFLKVYQTLLKVSLLKYFVLLYECLAICLWFSYTHGPLFEESAKSGRNWVKVSVW